MTKIRDWLMWSPRRFHVAVAAVAATLLLAWVLARVTEPTATPTATTATATTSSASGSTATATTRPATRPTATKTGHAPATKKTTPTKPLHTDLQATVTDFTRAWLSGHDAKDKTRWVTQVSQWATKEHTYWLGLTSLEAIPDADITSVDLPDAVGDLVLAKVHLTNGDTVQVAALWDGEQWQINNIEPA